MHDIDFEAIEEEFLALSGYVEEGDFDSAKELIEEILAEAGEIYQENDKERYFCFDSPLQFYIYDWKLEPKKQLKQSKIDFRTLHLCYAHMLLAEDCFEEAEEELRKAIYWNPVDTKVLFEFARLYRTTKEWNKFLIAVRAARSYGIHREALAAYYANLGIYYQEKQEVPAALSLFYFSESICPNALSAQGLKELESSAAVPPSVEELILLLQKDGLSYGADPELIAQIHDLAQKLKRDLRNQEAIYCLEILYELTGEEDYLREKDWME